jgi:hypothetical protein
MKKLLVIMALSLVFPSMALPMSVEQEKIQKSIQQDQEPQAQQEQQGQQKQQDKNYGDDKGASKPTNGT